MEATLPVGLIWRAVSWLPGFLLRWFVTKEKLAKAIHADIRPRGDQVALQGGELPEVQIWLTVVNHGHFPVELDRLMAELTVGAARMTLAKLNRVGLTPGTSRELLLRGPLTDSQVDHLKRNADRPFVALTIEAEFNSKIHNFHFKTGPLEGITPKRAGL